MSGIFGGLLATSAASAFPESHTLTTGNTGTAGVRQRGYSTGLFGSISPTSTTVGGGTLITDLYYDESSQTYILQVNSAPTPTNWTQMVVNGTTTFARTSATFAGSFWTWATSDTIANQVFGANGTNHSVVFS